MKHALPVILGAISVPLFVAATMYGMTFVLSQADVLRIKTTCNAYPTHYICPK